MKGAVALVVAGMVLSLWVNAKEGDGVPRFEVYPWSEQSSTVRLDKKILRELSIRSVAKTNSGTTQFFLTDNFITVFNLTSLEIQQITSAITNALHQYRTVESAHLEPAAEPQTLGRVGPVAPEDRRFSFRAKPFPEQAAAIRAKLEESVLATLGEERANFFWKNGRMDIETEMRESRKEQAPSVVGTITTRTYTFVLPAKHPGRVDLITSDVSEGPGPERGSGTAAGTFGEALDRYAPASMRPILAEWRKNATAAAAPAAIKRAPVAIAPATGEFMKWEARAAYVDVPKRLLQTLDVYGLNMDEDLTPEIKGLLSLRDENAKAVMNLYTELKQKFEKLERANFHRLEPGKNNFVVRAFPEESATLKREWAERLAKQLGPTRAEWLDQSIRGKRRRAFFRPEGNRGRVMGRAGGGGGFDSGPTWLLRGTEETRLDVRMEKRGGRPGLRIEFKALDGRGESEPADGQIPKRWQHLLTPDMLVAPLTL